MLADLIQIYDPVIMNIRQRLNPKRMFLNVKV